MNKSGVGAQVISHPQGGGAITALGETFSPDLHTGTGNLTVPIAVPAGRSKLQPDLSLVYSSGHGNGIFGLGWTLSIPGVARDTSRSIPVYDDDQDPFVLYGAEQLVPVQAAPGVAFYRPRTEGIFAKIAHHLSEKDDFWEAHSRNGLLSTFGTSGSRGADAAVVHDPDDPRRVCSWNLTETVDPFKNRISYSYEREPVTTQGPHRWDQIYLKTIRYGDYGPKDTPQFLISIEFIYEPRPDPFSTCRAGFEVRTQRRCSRLEVYTHSGPPLLVKTYQFTYEDEIEGQRLGNAVSLLRRITAEGVDGDLREALPPLQFSYTTFDPAARRYSPMGTAATVPERSLNHPDFELADLFGRGLPDVVQIGDANRYWRNLGEGRFDIPRPLTDLLPGIHLGDSGTQLADFDGDGQIDLLVSRPGLAGYVPLAVLPPDQVRPFVSSRVAPPFALNDPEVRFVDLDGDGITDALRTGTEFELYYHDRLAGWNRAELRSRDDLDRFPNVFFSDPRVKLADLTGDGLQDIVFVDNGRVDYWPYMGRGRWGARISMSGALRFPDAKAFGGIGFDPKRALLGDVDGDGAADLIYVESGRITIWMNQSGNGWSDPIVVYGTPPVTNLDAVRLADMLGTGTAGVLWTYDELTFADSTYKFLDLTGGTKPYLLRERNNNGGARTLVEYASSVRFYLEDERLPETRWQGRLPFPVQVVSGVEVIDALSQGKLTTEYRYHQGYWDGDEREFRGFGIVETRDTEAIALYQSQGLHGDTAFLPIDPVYVSPPTLTRTFFHQGQVQNSAGNWVEGDLSNTGWTGDPDLFSPQQRTGFRQIAQNAALEADPLRVRHALRALRGTVLRSELYALDESPTQDRPYTVTEALFDVREIASDPGFSGGLEIFFPFQIATRTTQWERGNDPMTQISFTAGHDEYGLPHSQLAIAVPRGRNPLVESAVPTEPYLSTYAVTEYARRDDPDHYIVDRVARSTGFEVVNDGRQSVFALRDAVSSGSAQLRVIGHERTFYDGDAFVGLPLGQIGEFGVPVRSESLAFTDAFLQNTFKQTSPPPYLTQSGWTAEYPAAFQAALPPLAGYVPYTDSQLPGSPGGYFVTAQRQSCDFHDPALVPRGRTMITRDPLGAETSIAYDSFDLFPVQVTDPVGLVTVAQYDYRVLQSSRITDPNGNLAEFRYSPAGMLVAQLARGKNGEGDASNPSQRMEYDLLAFASRGQPMSVRTIQRVHHDSETDVALPDRDATIESIDYFDGFARSIQVRQQAEDTLFGDSTFGGSSLSPDQSSPPSPSIGQARPAIAPPNVIVSGWQIYDNKGRIVEKYEPFFAQSWDFTPALDSQRGQKAILFYDPRGQVIRTVNPDGSEQRVVPGIPADMTDPSVFTPTPWETFTYDANDNAGRTHPATAAGYSKHWNTPTSIVVDAMGRTITAVARNGPSPDDLFTTHSMYDIQGNPLIVADALGRNAFEYVFDLAKRRWRVDSIDAGRRDTVPDAVGSPVEVRDSKGALALRSYDTPHRPVNLWARDDSAGVVTLRQTFEYGDNWADRNAARALNLLGQVTRHHDEAGLVTAESVDLKGNVLEKTRRMIDDAPILAVFNSAPANQWKVTPFQVNWQPSGQQSLADVEAALLEPEAYRTSATYDAVGRIKQMQFPQDAEGHRATLLPTYNSAGGLEKVQLDGTLYVAYIAYDAKGERALLALGNGVMTRYAYDPKTFRLARLRSEHYTQPDPLTYAPSGEVLQDFGYAYDLVGNILSIQDRTPNSGVLNNPDAANADAVLAPLLASGNALRRGFSYDPIYRLLSARGRECDQAPDDTPAWIDTPRCTDLTKTRGYTEAYQYDKMGNMLRLEHHNVTGGYVRAFSVESQNNRLKTLQIGQTSFAYAFDVNGNMISETTSRHFEWNHVDQMKVFRTQTDGAEPSIYAHYLYDATGQRVKKLVRKQGGQLKTTHYVDGVFEHHRWSGGTQSGENNTLHIMDDQQRVALLRVGPAPQGDISPPVQFQLGDHLGSSNAVVDAAGALVNREEFLPYGETSFGRFAKKRYRFTGMERDEESGLSYHSARYYAPWVARWVSCDPAGISAGANAYLYCAASPVQRNDVSGLDSQGQEQWTEEQSLDPTMAEQIHVDDLSVATTQGTANMTTQAQDKRGFAAQINSDMNSFWNAQRQIDQQYMWQEEADQAREDWERTAAAHFETTHAKELKTYRANIHRMDAAAKIGKAIAGGTVAVVGGFSAAAYLTTSAGVAGSFSFATTTNTGLVAVGGGGAVAGANELEEIASVIEGELASLEGQVESGLARVQDGLSTLEAGSWGRVQVVARLEINGREFWGWNGNWFNAFRNLSRFWGHAEIDVLNKASREVPTLGEDAVMWVSRSCCGGCLDFMARLGGNIPKAAQQMGLASLTIHTATETVVIDWGTISSWIMR